MAAGYPLVIPGWPEGPDPESISPSSMLLDGFRVRDFVAPRNDH
ncbi:hypothetical protein NK6_2026 [Bradyrhizobium diazoefficiens]|uniref:Uncharacterized protein n=1 Tax=Bradyrhizobium diazoefficiens TaxID=1355477 RepID=A0A0E4BLI5_9BRAD|nr:hypothetical protein NK6_2026 [Bradyrhizobium diazoefficiens]